MEGDVVVRKHVRLAESLTLQSTVTCHHPVKWKSRAVTDYGVVFDERPHCKLCNARCSYSCESCRVGLCLDIRDGRQVSCWKLYHSESL
jgi:hypothetical protein